MVTRGCSPLIGLSIPFRIRNCLPTYTDTACICFRDILLHLARLPKTPDSPNVLPILILIPVPSSDTTTPESRTSSSALPARRALRNAKRKRRVFRTIKEHIIKITSWHLCFKNLRSAISQSTVCGFLVKVATKHVMVEETSLLL